VRFIGDTALTVLADNYTLQFMKEGLVKKTKESRQNKTMKAIGTARILTMEEALREKEERKAREQQRTDEKERRAVLQGLVGFAKMVWGEFQMGKDAFE
jgi:hypothetical protein